MSVGENVNQLRARAARARAEAVKADRLADIGEAFTDEGSEVEFLDPADWVVAPPCEVCGCSLEGGHCYCCQPVFGYGERWKRNRHSAVGGGDGGVRRGPKSDLCECDE